MNSWLLEFQICPFTLDSSDLTAERKYTDVCFADTFFNKVKESVSLLNHNLSLITKKQNNFHEEGFLCLYSSPICSVLVQAFTNGVLTIDVHVFSNGDACITNENVEILRNSVLNIDGIYKGKTLPFKSLPPIKRGLPFSSYDTLSSGNLVEYDFDELVFDKDSPYQNVRILHSKQYGNCLFLDNDMNLAESDLSYTVAITGGGKENYKNKDVLILGGGDGGILKHLQNSGARMITMIDIDRVVIDAAKVHLRGICGSALDQDEGENYKIIVDDCVKHLMEFSKSGRKFDYIINDLTAIPISKEPVGSRWDFLRLILGLSLSVLKDDGKYFTQGNGASNISGLDMYEKQLAALDESIAFTKETVSVSSYMELWVFYTIWKSLDHD